MSLATFNMSEIKAPVIQNLWWLRCLWKIKWGHNYSQQINSVNRWREVCLRYIKHIVFKHLRTYLQQILDVIIINHHDKPNETCHCVYSKDVSEGVYYLLYENPWDIHFFLILLLGKVMLTRKTDNINLRLKCKFVNHNYV